MKPVVETKGNRMSEPKKQREPAELFDDRREFSLKLSSKNRYEIIAPKYALADSEYEVRKAIGVRKLGTEDVMQMMRDQLQAGPQKPSACDVLMEIVDAADDGVAAMPEPMLEKARLVLAATE